MSSWIIREAKPDELNFIYSTWLNSYRYDSFIGKACTNSIFFSEYAAVIDSILQKPETCTLVAYFEESPSIILSYLVYEPLALHYLFTKEMYRNNGIATDLLFHAFPSCLQGDSIEFSHRTFTSEPILEKYKKHLRFNPFKLYERLKSEGKTHV